MNHNSVRLSETQHNVLVGSLLGDGALRCKRNALLEVNHCLAQRPYVDWKYDVFRELVRTPPKVRASNGKRIACRFTTLSLAALTPYYAAFYSNGRKIIPQIELTPLALATWFTDDGSKSRNSVYLNTQQFDADSELRALQMLDSLGVAASLNRDTTYYRIRIACRSMKTFAGLVRPYIIPEMQYKLPDAAAMPDVSQTLIQ